MPFRSFFGPFAGGVPTKPEPRSARSELSDVGDVLVGAVLKHRCRKQRNDCASEDEHRDRRGRAIAAQQRERHKRGGAACNQRRQLIAERRTTITKAPSK